MLKRWLFKLLKLIAFVALYFTVLIPVRETTMTFITKNSLEVLKQPISVYEQGNRGITVINTTNGERAKARVPFGMNFFIGVIGLILIDATRKFYFIESAVQVFFGVIIASAFYFGVQGHPMALQIADMSSIYFLPLSSLFMVVLAFIEKKQRTTDQHEGNPLQAT